MPASHTFSAATEDAARVLGLEIARARRARRLTATELAERAGITRVTLAKVERGTPTVALGIYFELAVLTGLELFGADDRGGLRDRLIRSRERLDLLPERVREPTRPVRDDF